MSTRVQNPISMNTFQTMQMPSPIYAQPVSLATSMHTWSVPVRENLFLTPFQSVQVPNPVYTQTSGVQSSVPIFNMPASTPARSNHI